MNPSLTQTFAEMLEKWPGVGPRTAERFVYHLLRQPKEEIQKLIAFLSQIKENIKICPVCQNFSLVSPCEICADPRRDKSLICVVAEPPDIAAIEKTAEYRGLYHILGGVINAPEGITPENLKIKELIQRIKNLTAGRAKPIEIILALNATIEGETTSLYLARLLKPLPAGQAGLRVKITRLARGLPQGSDLQYADAVTLSNALKGRREI